MAFPSDAARVAAAVGLVLAMLGVESGAWAQGLPPKGQRHVDVPAVQLTRVDQGFTFSNPTFGVLPNGQTHAQDTLVTFAGWQYLGYWDANRNLALARRKLPVGAWEHLVFTDYQIPGQDSHNAVSVGICPADGTIHLAFDHHGDVLKYRKSVPGLATLPHGFPWESASFGPVTDTLDPAMGPLPFVTYPRFLRTPTGHLQFVYREFTAGNGNTRMVDYDAATGTWSGDRKITERSGSHLDALAGTSNARSAYFNRIDYDAYGTLHATWTWRESVPNSQGGVLRYNRDICYAYSEDGGHVWYSATHQQVADTDAGWAMDGASPVVVVSLPAAWGLLNDQAHAVDARGRVHVVMYHKDQPDTVVSFANPSNSHYYHYWGEADGTWNGQVLPWIGDRPKMITDGDGRLFLTHRTLYIPGLAVEMATPGLDYLDWQRVFWKSGFFGSTAHVDRPLFREAGLMSVPLQESPSSPGAASWLDVVDLVGSQVFPTPNRVAAVTRRTDLVTEQDAHVRNGVHAMTNFGGASFLRVQDATSPDEQRLGLLRFHFADLMNKGAVVSATLRMNVTASGPTWTPVQLRARRCPQDVWFENGVTWSNRPQPLPSAAAFTAQGGGMGVVTIDLTAMVQAELRGGGQRLTVELSQTTADAGSWVELETLEASVGGAATLEVIQKNALDATADTYVRGGIHATTNYGGNNRLIVKDDGNPDYDRIALLRFDLAGLAGTGVIRKVYLDLASPVMGPRGATTPYRVRYVGDDGWQEMTVTWNNRPPLGPPLAVHFGRARLRWDVTDQVSSELAGDEVLSLGVESVREGSARILHLGSREAASSLRPRLLIEY